MAPAAKKQKLSNGTVATIDAVETPAANDPAEIATAKKADEKPEQQRRSLFVRSLPASTTSEALTELFSESYPIKHATAVIDKDTKQCKGYGFVTFADAEDAAKAKTAFNGHVLEGKKLRVELAEPRHRDDDAAAGEVKAKREQEKAEQQPPKLIVRNLPWTIKKDKDLEKLFLSYGKVKQAYIPKRSGGLLPGFGFVLMRGRKNAEKAIAGVNGKEVDGRTIAVDFVVTKEVYKGQSAAGDELSAGADNHETAKPVDSDEEGDAKGEDESFSDGTSDSGVDVAGVDDLSAGGKDSELDEEMEIDRREDRSSTLFVRNLPFTCTDEDLEDHFTQFGSTRYARIVLDPNTERSRGTGFVCFYNKEDADVCLRGAPRAAPTGANAMPMQHSLLQNTDTDPAGKYTLDGRLLQVSRAVAKGEANRLTQEGAVHRDKKEKDKRRLYLLSEGTISSNSKLYESLAPSERTMREASGKQRKQLLESNPSLNLSLSRLSVRNLPRTVDSKELKSLAREAVVGFATDVKAGTRQKLSKEELERGGDEMVQAEKARKAAGKGVVKQTKVVFEGASGSKVGENTGAGRSRGYGFIEYYTHRSALMGLRWLNGHAVGYKVQERKTAASREEVQERKKRLIVEFAIENAQVVHRRIERESKARERSKAFQEGRLAAEDEEENEEQPRRKDLSKKARFERDKADVLRKRKRSDEKPSADGKPRNKKLDGKNAIDDKTAQRNRIIGRKRAMRRTRKGG